jgi:hypothetical protein
VPAANTACLRPPCAWIRCGRDSFLGVQISAASWRVIFWFLLVQGIVGNAWKEGRGPDETAPKKSEEQSVCNFRHSEDNRKSQRRGRRAGWDVMLEKERMLSWFV